MEVFLMFALRAALFYAIFWIGFWFGKRGHEVDAARRGA